MSLFGTSGIRDLCPQKVSGRLALITGNIFANGAKTIAVGYDSRQTGQMLKAAFSSGAMQAGANVHDLGICATPTLCLYTKQNKCLGAMITASHNPPQYNGIKLFENGEELPKEKEQKIEFLVEKALANPTGTPFNSVPYLVSWQGCGSAKNMQNQAKEAHLDLLLSFIDISLIGQKKPKVALDCANMAACALMPAALKAAGCEVIEINCHFGPPYGRDFEPGKKSLAALSKAIKKHKADLGIAHDGDADRAIIADEKGNVLGLDTQLSLAASCILEEGKKKPIVSTVESSLHLKEAVQSAGARLIITPVGSLHVAREMRKRGACFGGEPCGEYIFEGGAGSPDGLAAGLFFVQMFCKRGKLSSLASKIKPYWMQRLKIECKNENKQKAMEGIKKEWSFENANFGDGIRSDGQWGWILVRPSGTEPYLRITCEAKEKKILEEKASIAQKLVKKYCN